ncbi:MAG: hypothetical protein QX199_19445, partial [Methylococcaceae bacterium]
MEKSRKSYRNDYWLALPLLLSGGLNALGVAVVGRFAMTGLLTAAGLMVIIIGLYFRSRNRSRMSLQMREQRLLEHLQQEHDEKTKALQEAHHETVL